MKKLRYILASAILLGAFSCSKVESEIVTPETTAQDGKVTITFYVDAAEANPATKAFQDEPNIETMRVAVFGSSGYLKEYVKAEFTKAEENYDGTDNTKYAYSVRLSLNNSPLRVHFIANGPESLPFKYESEVVGKLLSESPQDCYWQRVLLPDGIKALANEDGEYYAKVGNATIDPETGDAYLMKDHPSDGEYIIDPDCVANMMEVSLVRNFARIQVTAADKDSSNVEVLGYVLMNAPKTGSVAPYQDGWLMTNDTDGVGNYQSYTFSELLEKYEGNFPATATLNTTIPTSETTFTEVGSFLYTYERPIPIADPMVVIVKAKFYPTKGSDGKVNTEDAVECYYKLNLQDENGDYLPIFRNFEYRIKINEIVRAGYSTPEDAATSIGSGDISSDISTQNLTDISDGKSRLYVEYTDKTLTKEGTYTLKVKYIPDVNKGTVDNSKISLKVESSNNPVFASGSTDGYDVTIGSSDVDGWRTVTYSTTSVESFNKVQKIKVIGTSGSSTLYRYVNVRLISQKEMVVECDPEYVLKQKGENLDVNISISKDLPESIFPLYFKIEPENQNLNPNNDNLPVYSGQSFLYKETTEDGKVYEDEKGNNASLLKKTNTFYYMKTLSYDDYLSYQKSQSDKDLVTFSTHFKTTDNTDNGGVVYVINDYFNDAYDHFYRYTTNNFSNLKYSTGDVVFEGEGEAVTFSFNTDEIWSSPITVVLTGLAPADGEESLTWVSGDTYTYAYENGHTSHSFKLVTTTEDVKVDVKLSAEYYYDNNLSAERGKLDFSNVGFTSSGSIVSGVSYGKDSEVTFSFDYVDGMVEPIIVKFDGVAPSTTVKQTYGTFTDNGDGTYTFTPSTSSKSVSFFLTTLNDDKDVSVTISNNHYNSVTTTASRLKHKFSNFSFGTTYLGAGNSTTFTFTYETGAIKPIQITFRAANDPSSDYGTFEKISSTDSTFTYKYTPSENAPAKHTITLRTTGFGGYMQADLSEASYESATANKGRTLSFKYSNIHMNGDNLRYWSNRSWSYSYRAVTFKYGSSTLATITPNAYSYPYSYYSSSRTYTKEFGEKEDVNGDDTVTASYSYSSAYTYSSETTLSYLQNAYSNIIYLDFE